MSDRVPNRASRPSRALVVASLAAAAASSAAYAATTDLLILHNLDNPPPPAYTYAYEFPGSADLNPDGSCCGPNQQRNDQSTSSVLITTPAAGGNGTNAMVLNGNYSAVTPPNTGYNYYGVGGGFGT